jgi:hypothetical protein
LISSSSQAYALPFPIIQKMNAILNRRFYAVLAGAIGHLKGEQHDDAKADIIRLHTQNKKHSAADLTDAEAEAIITAIQDVAATQPKATLNPPEGGKPIAESPLSADLGGAKRDKWGKPIPNPEAEPMRRYMLKLGMQKGKDFKFTKGWCEKQGVNGEKKKFNDYTVAELKKLSEIFISIQF